MSEQMMMRSAHDFDPAKLAADLEKAGLVLPSGVRGVFGRGPVFEEVLQRFDALVLRMAKEDGAESLTFPPVMSRKVLERVHYFESFPHLCGAVCSFTGTELQARELAARVPAGQPWADLLTMTDVALVPAACYQLYPTLAGMLPGAGRLVTIQGWVFRHEPSPEPTRMQSFRMREIIRAGSAEQTIEWRNSWVTRAERFLESVGLDISADTASDPFFGRAGRMLALDQKEQRLKIEIRVPVISLEQPTAVASFNLHQEHFGATFDIKLQDGSVAHTACLGFGLERIVMALFKTHGCDPAKWSASVRRQLWG